MDAVRYFYADCDLGPTLIFRYALGFTSTCTLMYLAERHFHEKFSAPRGIKLNTIPRRTKVDFETGP